MNAPLIKKSCSHIFFLPYFLIKELLHLNYRISTFKSQCSQSYFLAILFSYFLFFASCNPTKHIPQNEYLLKSVNLKIDNKSITKDQLRPYIRQRPNKKIVGVKFHLWLYNSSKPEKINGWNKWLRKNGEEPVIWQQNITDKSVVQLKLFLRNKGYYYAHVTDTVILKKKKADVIYKIKTGWAYTVNRVTYSIPDTTIARLILADTLNSLLKPGILLDEDILKNEKKRIETNLKNKGYYSFAADFIDYKGDSTNLNRKVNINLIVKSHTERSEDHQVVEAPYPQYSIRSVNIISQQFTVKKTTIKNSVYIFPDSLYRLSNVNQTYQHLHGLRNFRLVNIDFSEPAEQTGLLMRDLDCNINLLPLTRQYFNVDPELTTSEGNLGGGVRFLYQNKSLFGHAEFFDLKLRGAAEAVATKQDGLSGYKAKMEYEAEATLNVPKFLLPIRSDRFIQKYNPKTMFSILYNYQQYPEYYVRTVLNTSFGYNWRGSDVISHLVKLVDVNFIQLPYKSPAFDSTLNRYPYLKNSYQSHLVVSSSYTFVRDMRMVNRDNSFYIRASFETAGLLLDGINRLSGKPKQTGIPYEMFKNQFSQFIKGDVDLRYYYTINGNNQMVARIFTGVGLPYGNSRTNTINKDTGTSKTVVAMPFEKKYYAGGANSMRGWRLRSLGPGSYRDSASFTSYPNNTGDIKLEANLEYRFKLVWVLEGALFADVGNVWDSHKDEDRPGADFSFNRFYRELAMTGGLGLRLDFKYFIFRVDWGMKVRDPADSGRWAFTPKPDGSKRFNRDDFCWSIAIGYPFF